jgi:hypothetical protein
MLQASNLRNRMYEQAHRIEILELAMEDIARINAHSASPNALIASIVIHCEIDRDSRDLL